MRKNKLTHMMAGIFIIIFSLIFVILSGRFIYIQATGEVNGISLEEWAEEKRTSSYSISAERGMIYDKKGMTLAYDRPTYKLYAIIDETFSENRETPVHVVDPEKTAQALAEPLEVDSSELLESLQSGYENERFQVEFGNIGRELSQNKKEEIEALNLPGINFEEQAMRYYPNGVFASHIIGFARESEEEIDGSIVTNVSGVTGIEREMDELLHGKNGYISYKRDLYNVPLLNADEIVQEPEDGDDVYLTLDQKIQTLLEESLDQVQAEYEPTRTNAVVMNAKTGEILAMASRPSYNPNNPANVENWYNDVISSPIEPGSTVKMFTWAAAIDDGVYDGDELLQSGTYVVNQQIKPIRDVNQGQGWGAIPYDEGFERSSNVAASKLVWEKMGTERFLDYLHAFDIGEVTGIDLPGEVSGEILYNWPLEKLTTAFGQGSTVTPIQMVKAASAIANDGKMMRPYVIDKIVDSTTGDVLESTEPEVVSEPITEETSQQVRDLLRLAIEGENATGKKYQLDDYSIGGKTGTAQIPDPDEGGYLQGRGNNIFSFLGMAPIEDPELIVFASVQQPELEMDQVGSDPVSFIVNNVVENSLHYLNIDPDNRDDDQSINRIEIPELIDKHSENLVNDLEEIGLNVTLIGEGEEILAANVHEGEMILPNKKVILLTNEPTMPDVSGWSRREVVQFADLLDLKLETFGNGYVVMQSIEPGTTIQENAYLGIELLPPTEEWVPVELPEEAQERIKEEQDVTEEPEDET